MHCGIYVITERATGKMYVGMSKNIEDRWTKHNKRFCKQNFTYEIIHPCDTATDKKQLRMLEKFYIKELDCMVPNGFNKSSGGEGFTEISYETREKLRAVQARRQPLSAESRKKISDSKIGKKKGPTSEEIKKKLSESMKGKNTGSKSEETKRKLSESQKGRSRGPTSEETKKKMSEAAKRRAANKRLQEGLNG